MLTSKQRAQLRALANKENAIFQIGKGGITDAVVAQIQDAISVREIVKVSVLETALLTAREACDAVCDAIAAQPVQCIGNKFVIYKEADKQENRKIILA